MNNIKNTQSVYPCISPFIVPSFLFLVWCVYSYCQKIHTLPFHHLSIAQCFLASGSIIFCMLLAYAIIIMVKKANVPVLILDPEFLTFERSSVNDNGKRVRQIESIRWKNIDRITFEYRRRGRMRCCHLVINEERYFTNETIIPLDYLAPSPLEIFEIFKPYKPIKIPYSTIVMRFRLSRTYSFWHKNQWTFFIIFSVLTLLSYLWFNHLTIN